MLRDTVVFRFEVEGCDEQLKVVSFSGQEGMSSLFELQLELACDGPAIELVDVLAKPAVLSFDGDGSERFIHGILSRFEQVNELRRHIIYRATLVPEVWKLKKRFDCRIFQELTTPQIIRKVLDAANVPSDCYKLSFSATYSPRNYCVQYRESDWDFLSRLMEEDGIFYHFEHDSKKAVLHFADASSACAPISGGGLEGEVIPFRRSLGMTADSEHVRRFSFTQAVQPGKVTLTDFNFKQPSLQLQSEAKGDGEEASLEVYDYPGEYQHPGSGSAAEGDAIARIRLEEQQAQRAQAYGESGCDRLMPGRFFTLSEHSRDAFNARYLLTQVGHVARHAQVLEEEGAGQTFHYSNDFVCIPADVPYRPRRKTRKPLIRGVQTALVVGPSGEEIYTDEFGRVKVHFHWDRQGKRDEKSSCWIRVAQVWAGEGWGGMCIPRVGQEVIVSFIEGDPDRPLITGRVYNGAQTPPYVLPDDKTKSTLKSNSSPGGEGFNELRFEDGKGREQLFMHAERNMDVWVKRDSMAVTRHDRHQTIGSEGDSGKVGDQNELIYRDQSLKVHRHRQEHIGGDMRLTIGGIDGDGNCDIVIHGSRKERVEKDSHLHIQGGLLQKVEGTYSLSTAQHQTKVSGKYAAEAQDEVHLKSRTVVIEAAMGVTLRGPGGFITIDSGGVVIQGNLVKINSGGSALSGSGARPESPEKAEEAAPTPPKLADDGRRS
jgi:type VI secretion system secreted protein VgrG